MTKNVAVLLASIAISVTLPAAWGRAESTLSEAQKDKVIAELKNEIKQLEQRVEMIERQDQRVDQKVRIIDRKLEVQQETELAKAKDLPVVKAGPQGFSLSSANPEDWQLRLRGLVQADGRFFTGGKATGNASTFFLNRVRPIFEGTLWKYYNFNITPDFGQGRAVLQDSYIDAKYFPEAQVLFGKTKAPFGLERLQSDKDLVFIERGMSNNLVTNRDTGVILHSDLFDSRLTYQLALMNGVPNDSSTTDTDVNDGKDFIGRLFATPFKTSDYPIWAKGLGLGFAGTYGDERNGTISSYRTAGRQTFFTYNSGVTAAGARYYMSPQAYYYFGPLGLLAEYVTNTQAFNRNILVKKGKFNQYVNDYETFTDRGYNVQASYVLTGEDSSYYGVKPYHPFDPRNGTWGAFEVGARVGSLAADSGKFKLNFVNPSVSARTATEYGVAFNWYLSQNVKWQLNYVRTFFDKGGPGGSDRPDESVISTQLQLYF